MADTATIDAAAPAPASGGKGQDRIAHVGDAGFDVGGIRRYIRKIVIDNADVTGAVHMKVEAGSAVEIYGNQLRFFDRIGFFVGGTFYRISKFHSQQVRVSENEQASVISFVVPEDYATKFSDRTVLELAFVQDTIGNSNTRFLQGFEYEKETDEKDESGKRKSAERLAAEKSAKETARSRVLQHFVEGALGVVPQGLMQGLAASSGTIATTLKNTGAGTASTATVSSTKKTAVKNTASEDYDDTELDLTQQQASGTAEVDAASTVATGGTVSIPESADVTAQGSASASASVKVSSAVEVSGTGQTTVSGTTEIAAGADITASGSLQAAGAQAVSGAVTSDGQVTQGSGALGSVEANQSASIKESAGRGQPTQGPIGITAGTGLADGAINAKIGDKGAVSPMREGPLPPNGIDGVRTPEEKAAAKNLAEAETSPVPIKQAKPSQQRSSPVAPKSKPTAADREILNRLRQNELQHPLGVAVPGEGKGNVGQGSKAPSGPGKNIIGGKPGVGSLGAVPPASALGGDSENSDTTGQAVAASGKKAAPDQTSKVDSTGVAANQNKSGDGEEQSKGENPPMEAPVQSQDVGSKGTPSSDESDEEEDDDADDTGADDETDAQMLQVLPQAAGATSEETDRLISEAVRLVNPYMNGFLIQGAIWVWSLALPTFGLSIVLGALIGDFLLVFKKRLIRMAVNRAMLRVMLPQILVGKQVDPDQIASQIKFSWGVKANLVAMNVIPIIAAMIFVSIAIVVGCNDFLYRPIITVTAGSDVCSIVDLSGDKNGSTANAPQTSGSPSNLQPRGSTQTGN